MKKYCTSNACIVAEAATRKRKYVMKDKVEKAVEENVLECPDCEQQLQVFKMRRKLGKMSKDLYGMRF